MLLQMTWTWNLRIQNSTCMMMTQQNVLLAKQMAILTEKLKTDTDKIVLWCDENRMATNDQKSKSMLIRICQKFYKLPIKQLHVFIRDHKLEVVRVKRLLGVSIDKRLTWKLHTDNVYKTVSMVLAKFRKIKPFYPVDAWIKFCQAFMFAHLDYCSYVCGSAKLEWLFKLQKRAARIIYDLPTRTPTAPLLKQLNWIESNIEKQLWFLNLWMALPPQYMKDLFQFVGEVSCCSTPSKLYLAPGSHLNVYTDIFKL